MGIHSQRWVIIAGLFLIYIILAQGYSTTPISPVTSYFPLDRVTDDSTEEVSTNETARLRLWNRSTYDFEQVSVHHSGMTDQFEELSSGQTTDYFSITLSEERIPVEVVLNRNASRLQAFLPGEPLSTESSFYTLALDVGLDEATLTLELMQIVMMVEFEGGLCPYGICRSTIDLYSDGTYVTADGSGAQTIGRVTQISLQELVQRIEDTDFVEIRSQAFTGTCPTAFDGQEVTYTFYTMDGVEQIPSCMYQVDPSAPLFRIVTRIIVEQVSTS